MLLQACLHSFLVPELNIGNLLHPVVELAHWERYASDLKK